MVVILLLLAAVIFLLQKLSRINPVHAYLGANASQAAIAKETDILGYNGPSSTSTSTTSRGLLHGNLGTSLRTRRPVATDLATYLPATLELTLFGLVLAVVLGAVLAWRRPARWRGAGVFRFVMLAGRLGTRPSCWPSSASSSSTATSTGCRRPGTPASPTRRPGRPGMLIVDTLVHGQFGHGVGRRAAT